MNKFAISVFTLFLSFFAFSQSEKWKSLFNGINFDGWEQRGGAANYTIEYNTIKGTSKINSPNSFLCTKKTYKDFIFECELKVDTFLNSGIQFRSNSKVDFKNGVVHGYQCEIDPSARAFSGGVYDEQRRGWLYKPENDERARKAFNKNGWNKYRIEAIGSKIKTFINEIPISNIVDTVDASGFIGLQVHSIDNTIPGHVMWRNLRIVEK